MSKRLRRSHSETESWTVALSQILTTFPTDICRLVANYARKFIVQPLVPTSATWLVMDDSHRQMWYWTNGQCGRIRLDTLTVQSGERVRAGPSDDGRYLIDCDNSFYLQKDTHVRISTDSTDQPIYHLRSHHYVALDPTGETMYIGRDCPPQIQKLRIDTGERESVFAPGSPNSMTLNSKHQNLYFTTSFAIHVYGSLDMRYVFSLYCENACSRIIDVAVDGQSGGGFALLANGNIVRFHRSPFSDTSHSPLLAWTNEPPMVELSDLHPHVCKHLFGLAYDRAERCFYVSSGGGVFRVS